MSENRTWSVIVHLTVEATDREEAEAWMLEAIPNERINAARAVMHVGTVLDDGGRAARRQLCGDPGIYVDSPDYDDHPEAHVSCEREQGHTGWHQEGGHRWGNMADLTEAEKLSMLGVDSL